MVYPGGDSLPGIPGHQFLQRRGRPGRLSVLKNGPRNRPSSRPKAHRLPALRPGASGSSRSATRAGSHTSGSGQFGPCSHETSYPPGWGTQSRFPSRAEWETSGVFSRPYRESGRSQRLVSLHGRRVSRAFSGRPFPRELARGCSPVLLPAGLLTSELTSVSRWFGFLPPVPYQLRVELPSDSPQSRIPGHP